MPLSRDGESARVLVRTKPDGELFGFVTQQLRLADRLERSLSQASDAFEISSRRKISLLRIDGMDHQMQELLHLGLEGMALAIYRVCRHARFLLHSRGV